MSLYAVLKRWFAKPTLSHDNKLWIDKEQDRALDEMEQHYDRLKKRLTDIDQRRGTTSRGTTSS